MKLVLLAAASLCSGSALAQGSFRDFIQPATSLRHAGTYDVATGRLRRAPAGQTRGSADVVYENTAIGFAQFTSVLGPTGPAAGLRLFDDGGIPGLTNLDPFSGTVTREHNLISGVTIAYCDFDTAPGVSGWELEFYETFGAGGVAPGIPTSVVSLAGLPSNGCWFLDVDLSSSPVCLSADGGVGNPGWQDVPERDSFMVSVRYTGTGTAAAGLLLAGDPALTDAGWAPGTLPRAAAGTYFGIPNPCPIPGGTGYLNSDSLGIEGITGVPNFTAPGGYQPAANPCSQSATPYGGIYLQLRSDGQGSCTAAEDIGMPLCSGSTHVQGFAAGMVALGSDVATDDDVTLVANVLPTNTFCLFATGRAAAAMPIASGNGFVCIDPFLQGGLGRFNQPQQIVSSGRSGVASLSTRAGQWSVSAIPTATGSYAAMPGVTSHFQCWYRDVVGAGFNFSAATSITWR